MKYTQGIVHNSVKKALVNVERNVKIPRFMTNINMMKPKVKQEDFQREGKAA